MSPVESHISAEAVPIHHAQGLVSVLMEIHDELDRGVFDAYGSAPDLDEETSERATEERQGMNRLLLPQEGGFSYPPQLLR